MGQVKLFERAADDKKPDPLANLAAEAVGERAAAWRRVCEDLVRLSEHLELDERIVIQSVFETGMPLAMLARLSGRSPRAVQRQVKRIVARMESPMFRFVATGLDLLPRDVQPVARRHYLWGWPLRRVAKELDLKLHEVRAKAMVAQVHKGLLATGN